MILANENTRAIWPVTTTRFCSWIRPAEAILLFGPGKAEGQLRKRIERNELDLRITCLEKADKMTETAEILAKSKASLFAGGHCPPP